MSVVLYLNLRQFNKHEMVKILERLWWLNLTKSWAASHIRTCHLSSVSDTNSGSVIRVLIWLDAKLPQSTWLFKARACSWAWASGVSGWSLKIVVSGPDSYWTTLWSVSRCLSCWDKHGSPRRFYWIWDEICALWELRRHRMVVCYQRFGTTYQFAWAASLLNTGPDCLSYKDGPDRLSWNMGNKLPFCAA
jgi:hypothetical protein